MPPYQLHLLQFSIIVTMIKPIYLHSHSFLPIVTVITDEILTHTVAVSALTFKLNGASHTHWNGSEHFFQWWKIYGK